ncbi:hypothetical protein AT433_004601 [Escherichia coli]|jgi:hypothetical protein|nr:hypothetical protein [Escherichia coli]EFK2341936.1 hypothetical protein [Escherichia coli]EFK9532850.1 hypothetical protein [Escherichia coli]HAH6937909.1 hypothetical protein [Escherichia coli]HAI6403467.1 hypothetical protein [Escherichia coli]
MAFVAVLNRQAENVFNVKSATAKAHKGESLHPDGKQALPCCRSRYIVHNVWVINAYWVTTGRIFEYHWRCQPV